MLKVLINLIRVVASGLILSAALLLMLFAITAQAYHAICVWEEELFCPKMGDQKQEDGQL